MRKEVTQTVLALVRAERSNLLTRLNRSWNLLFSRVCEVTRQTRSTNPISTLGVGANQSLTLRRC